jgi:hypothetical protein
MSSDTECLADHDPPPEFTIASEITVARFYPARDPDTESRNGNEVSE